MSCGRERPLDISLSNAPGSASRIYFGAGMTSIRRPVTLWSILIPVAILAIGITFIGLLVR